MQAEQNTPLEDKILILELVKNGSAWSLIDDEGDIWATGCTSCELLKDAATIAHRYGYESIIIEPQSWDVDRLLGISC